MPNTVQGLVLRIPNGQELTPAQGDKNLQILANFCNLLSSAIAGALLPNGQLKPGALSALNQIANLSLFADAFDAALTLPAGVFDTVSQYSFTNTNLNGQTALTAGARIQFIAGAANLGDTTVLITTQTSPATVLLPAYKIYKGVNNALAANDILANSVVELVFDGAAFQLVSMFQLPATTTSLGVVQLATAAEVLAGTDPNKAVTPLALGAGSSFTSTLYNLPSISAGIGAVLPLIPHALGVVPRFVRWVFVCQSGENGWTTGQEMDLKAVAFLSGNVSVGFTTGADATNLLLAVYPPADGGNLIAYANPATGAESFMTFANWKLKVYARA